ncbi:uncharacterized protein LOC129928829 isoform X2 [Biomphalaria glabrata]|uniref:Uncharacterized protein LOC129928829 isoform X2 n=1 Tax=Biomphalaria glabrata TaxID=6526 RepID=A0A9W3BND7_BIOGL|nr:uncharacterized protein LOC129928829 isoform X2 [Biomphalaria glabrata]
MLEANTRLKEIMLQYEASEVTGDQMPDQVNVTFSTETKSLTKLNLRRSRHFDLDIPLYTLDTNQEGIFHRHKVKTRPKKTVASSSFIDRDASYDEMNADTAIDNLQAFNIGSGSSIVGIYDHVMLLTGYNLFTADGNNNKQDTLGLASKKVAEDSMEKAAREVKEKVGISNEEGITDCGVSVDGTWQRRGHSSHHGVVTAISIETGLHKWTMCQRPIRSST